MKKLIASFAVIIYFAFSCGVMVNLHYCMDRYDSFRLYSASSDYCTKCGMHTKYHGCCHDEVTILKLNDDHQTSSAFFAFKTPEVAIVTFPDLTPSNILVNDISTDYLNHSPPLLSEPDIYIKNRVFRV